MNHKKLKHAFMTLIVMAETRKCEDLHHNKTQLHSSEEACPAEYELNRQAHIVREYMKEAGIV